MAFFFEKINSFISIAQIWQLPLVLFLAVLSYRAVNVVHIKQLSTIGLAFAFNLCYIICDFLSARHSPFYPFVNINNAFLIFLAVLFDLLTTLCFLLAALSALYGADLQISRHGPTWASKPLLIRSDITRKLLVPVFLPFVAILLALFFVGNDNVFVQIGRSLYSFVGLMAVAYLFAGWRRSHGASFQIAAGFFIWGVLQWLGSFTSLLGENATQALGFSISLIAKFFIIYGMFSWHVAYALESARQRDLETIEKEQFLKSSEYFGGVLAKTFHELNLPMRNLESSLDRLNSYVAREARIQFTEVENHYEQVQAVIDVSKNSYLRNGSALDPEDHLPKSRRTTIVKVNNLLAFAIRSIRTVYKSEVQYSLEYGGKCYIECVPSEMIQVFLNLLKNAVESYPPNTHRRHIRIKTYRNKAGHTDFRHVIVEIEDFGPGVSSKVINNIWEPGVTTKSVDEYNAVRGQGMHVVKEIIDRMQGARITMVSPSLGLDTDKPFGTLFTLTFPRKELPNEEKNKT